MKRLNEPSDGSCRAFVRVLPRGSLGRRAVLKGHGLAGILLTHPHKRNSALVTENYRLYAGGLKYICFVPIITINEFRGRVTLNGIVNRAGVRLYDHYNMS